MVSRSLMVSRLSYCFLPRARAISNLARPFSLVKSKQGSWIEPVRELRYPVVVSNPPYVAEGDEALAALKREPVSALVAPDNGLGGIRLLAETVPAVLAEGGIFLFEHGAEQAEEIDALLSDTGWTAIETFTDLAGLPRITRARRGS